jgi:hypothetical protein
MNGADEEAEIGHGGDDRSDLATVCLVHVAGTIPGSAGQLLGDEPSECQQTVVEICARR